MSDPILHRRAIFLMVVAATLWSIAGVVTRHLDAAKGFEVTFWRSIFAAIFIAVNLLRQGGVWAPVRGLGMPGLLSGMMWGIMFCCFMIAMTMTTVANTLIVMSISPLLTAFLAWFFLQQRIAVRTWLAIGLALIGIVWMFANGLSHVAGMHMTGMLVALGVPVAASVNMIVIKKAGHGVDLMPSILLGGVFSALAMLPLAWPLQASTRDVAILAFLGFFQLAFPCMLMLKASRFLSAPEIAMLALLEVLLGPLWAWLGAGEVAQRETLQGGALVLAALIINELAAPRPARLASS